MSVAFVPQCMYSSISIVSYFSLCLCVYIVLSFSILVCVYVLSLLMYYLYPDVSVWDKGNKDFVIRDSLLSSSLLMLSDEIYLRLKPYLVVKISSDIVTNIAVKYAFCLWCFAAPTAGWHDKWLRNQTRSRRTMWFDLTC